MKTTARGLMSVRDVYNYLNKVIGINQIRALMTSGTINSFLLGNKYVTEQKYVDGYINLIQNKTSTKYPDQTIKKLCG